MRRMKQCLGGLVAMLVLLTSIPFTVLVAADTTTTTTTTQDVTFTVGSVEASVGDIVTIPVEVTEDHYMVNGTIAIHYDPTVLELQAACDDEDNPYFEECNPAIFNSRFMWAFGLTEPGVATLSFATSSDKGPTAGGTMFELTFKILNEDADGTLIRPEIFEMRSNDGVKNGGEDYDTVYNTVPGVVTLKKEPAMENVTFTVGSVEASAGDIIKVPVMVSENHYMVNGTLAIEYDPVALELQEVCDNEDNPYFEECNPAIFGSKYMWGFDLKEDGIAKFVFSASGATGTTAGGTMFELTFKVRNEYADGTMIECAVFELYSNDGVTNGGEDSNTVYNTVPGVVTLKKDPVVFSVGSVEASVGDIIKVPVMVSENHYMVNGTLAIEYDPVALELQEVCDNEDNPYFEECNPAIFGSKYMWGFGLKEDGIAKFVFAASGPKGTTAGGTMFELTFKVRNEYADGTMIECSVFELYSNDGVTNGGEDSNTVYNTVPGIVTLKKDPVTFSVGSVEASVGDIIKVPVKVTDNHYMVNGTLAIEYDPTVLELQKVCDDEDNPYFEACNAAIFNNKYMWAFGLTEPGVATFAFATNSDKGATTGGTMFELTFKVRNEYADGTMIECSVFELYSNDGVTNGGEDSNTVYNTVPGIVTLKKDPVVFSVGSVTASVGDIIKVPVMVSENHYMVSGQIHIKYDPTALELQKVCDDEDNPYFEACNAAIFNNKYMWAFGLTEPGVATFAFATNSDKGATTGGTMFELTFKVLDTDANDTVIDLTVPEMRANDGVTNGGEDYDLVVNTIAGIVRLDKVVPPLLVVKGDIDGNGIVNTIDALRLYTFCAGRTDLPQDRFEIADYDGNGVISMIDAVRVFHVASGRL